MLRYLSYDSFSGILCPFLNMRPVPPASRGKAGLVEPHYLDGREEGLDPSVPITPVLCNLSK